MAFDESIRKQHEALLQKLEVGHSFFIEAHPSELTYVRRMAYRLKMRLSIRYVHCDEIYGKSGSRVMRMGRRNP